MEQPNDAETGGPSLTERLREEGISEDGPKEQPRASAIPGCLGIGCLLVVLLILTGGVFLYAFWESVTTDLSWLEFMQT
jgi:hypothetical protein